MKPADYWIQKLGLARHPEGGYYREIYRSAESIPKEALPDRYDGLRVFSTSIYYLLPGNEVSYFHRLKSDEVWHFCRGSPVSATSSDHPHPDREHRAYLIRPRFKL